MQNSRLIQLLEILKPAELKELNQFIQCKFFHTNKKRYEKVLLLFKEIISPKWKIVILTQEELARKLFESAEEQSNIRHYISQSIDLVQKYLVCKYETSDSKKSDHTLLKIFNKRKNKHLCKLQKSKVERNMGTAVGSDYFYSHFKLAKDSLVAVDSPDKKTVAKNNANLKTLVSNLDLFFLVNQFNYACIETDFRVLPVGEKFNLPFLEILLKEIPNTPYFDEPIIKMYWHAYKMLNVKTENHYLALKNLLFENYATLKEYYHKHLFHHLENYCAITISKGNHEYFSDLWEIAIFRLEKKLLKELTLAEYKNLITTGVMLALKESNVGFTDVLQFVEKYTNKVPLKSRKDAAAYAQTYIAFHQGNYKVAPQELIISEEPKLTIYKFKDIYYQVDSRRLLIMAYFCLEQVENFDKMCKNLRVFLDERKGFISAIDLERNQQFLIIVRKIFKVYGTRTEQQEQFLQIKKEIENCPSISDRTWLLKQVEPTK